MIITPAGFEHFFRELSEMLAAGPPPSEEAIPRLAAEYGVADMNLVKPGVGETTRVLLRRVPWKVLVRRDAERSLEHVLLLAEQRGAEVVLVEDLSYSCVGIVRPGFTRGGATAAGPAT